MARRGRAPVTVAAPVQAGPPQSTPSAGEFPAGPVGMKGGKGGNVTLPTPGMHRGKVSKAKHKHAKGK